MPTEKRQRQKEGQRARREQALAELRRRQRRRRLQITGIFAVVVVALLVISTVVGGDGNDDEKGKDNAASSTTSTTERSTTPTSAKPAVPAADPRPVTKLEIEDIKVGTGPEVKAGDTIVAHYLGATYADGKEFQSSWDTGDTFEAVIGRGEVIKGWDEGIPGMRVGGRRKLIIPAADAYEGVPDRPQGVLVFIVDVYDVK